MIVVKVGGASGISYAALAKDLAKHIGTDCVVVHGGSEKLNELSTALGKPPITITSSSGQVSRRTDKETMQHFMMVYCGLMNKTLVEELQKQGINAIGLSGLDGQLLMGKRKNVIIEEGGIKKVLRDDFTGTIEKVNVALLNVLMQQKYVPVITPPAISYEFDAINVDGDRAAAHIAIALKADTLIILSNVPGLLKNKDDPNSLVEHIPKEHIDSVKSYAQGRMKKKLMGAQEAINGGVLKVVIGDARLSDPLTAALNGKGTVIA